LIANTALLFAVSKPPGIASCQHEWTLGRPDLSMALRRELLNKKPQLADLGIEGLYRAYNLDAELSGALIFAKDEDSEGFLKNAAGSGLLRYRFHLLARTDASQRELSCDLPLAKHFSERRMLVSHKTGKKCETRFSFVRSFGAYGLWEAETSTLRTHQVRVHAAECGLSVVGEKRYGMVEDVLLSRLKKDYRPGGGRERPLNQGVCIHLLEVAFKTPEDELETIRSPLPRKFETLLRRLSEYPRRR